MTTDVLDNPRAVIGGNAPPLTPFDVAEKEINDLYAEAKLWLDGGRVDSQELADGISNLLTMLRAAADRADAARLAEKKPFDDSIAEIQDRYAPLIADTKATKGKTALAIAACKQALAPWLAKKDAEIKEAARLAREETDRKMREAQVAIRQSDATNLEARAAAEQLVKDAKRAEATANKASRQTATAGGAMGRATGLRTVYTPVLTDARAALRHYWPLRQSEFSTLLLTQAEQDVRAGKHGKNDIPGFEISETKVAV